MTVFAMLGSLMFCSKIILAFAPNIHLLALFIMAFTLVYRAKALIPLYVFVLLDSLYEGFQLLAIADIYAWLPLWLIVMLLPRRMPKRLAVPLYMVIGAAYGFLFGLLCAPPCMLVFHLPFLAVMLQSIPFDALHAAGNFAACALVLPLSKVLFRLEKRNT